MLVKNNFLIIVFFVEGKSTYRLKVVWTIKKAPPYDAILIIAFVFIVFLKMRF